jgi:hypothetical protein
MTPSFDSKALARWGLLELVQREERRDLLMASVPLPAPAVLEVLRSQWRDDHEEDTDQWCARYGTEAADFDALVTRAWRWKTFCEQRFAASLASTFLRRKPGLDQVCFWKFTVQDEDFASELYQRLREGEATMQQLKAQFCGPLALEQLPLQLRAVLTGLHLDQVSLPLPEGNNWALLQLQQRLPAALDEVMRCRLLLELGETLLEPRVNSTSSEG